MRWLAVACALALLAGCTEGPATPPVEADAQPDEPGRTARQGRDRDRDEDDEGGDEEGRGGNVTLRTYSDEYGFTLTSANTFFQFNIQGSNCVAIEGAPFRIVNGTALLTWASQSALTDELQLEVRTYSSDDVYQTASGPSPLLLEFEDIEVEADRDFEDVLFVAVQLPGPAGAAYEQDVAMALSFDYESDIDVYTQDSYC